MIDVDIWNTSYYFRNPKTLERLNQHIKLHVSFQVHQIATATGCSLIDAIYILHKAVMAGALQETTIYYNRHTNEAVYIGELETLSIVDEEQDRTLEENDLYWEPYFYVAKPVRETGWQFIKSK